MKRWLLVVSFILFGARDAVAQSGPSTPSLDVQKLVTELVRIQRTWGPETSTPGMSLTLREEDRVESNSNSSMQAATWSPSWPRGRPGTHSA